MKTTGIMESGGRNNLFNLAFNVKTTANNSPRLCGLPFLPVILLRTYDEEIRIINENAGNLRSCT